MAGNWKMNTTPQTAVALARAIARSQLPHHIDIVLCPPAVSVTDVARAVVGTPLRVGVQNTHWLDAGPYTGEISVSMLIGVADVVLIGHSERRTLFGETDDNVRRKLAAVLTAGLTPILCVGETETVRDAGNAQAVVAQQVRSAVDLIDVETARSLVLAYEPVWAIGTGRTATPQQAAEAINWIREALGDALGRDTAQRTRVLYGGSVTPDNAHDLLAMYGIDGALVGGASLSPSDFVAIASAAVA